VKKNSSNTKGMKDLIVIIGPTSSGKTALAIKLAKKINGEVISADSRQVYKHIDLASGKATKKEMSGVPHHMIDVVSPKKVFTVHDFKVGAERVIDDIVARGKTPIICGGTGFYVDTLLFDRNLPEVAPDLKLRKELSKKTTAELFSMLKEIDPDRAEEIDAKNPTRLIRAIEIAKSLGKVPKVTDGPKALYKKYKVEIIYVDLPDEKLFKKIKKRIDERLADGMVSEVKKLHTKHQVSWKRLYEIGLECRFISMHLQGKISLSEMREQLFLSHKQYVKRQRTWFNKTKISFSSR
jgi:tRNA dimethylallyltransferase